MNKKGMLMLNLKDVDDQLQEINELCLDWFNEATGQRVNMSGHYSRRRQVILQVI